MSEWVADFVNDPKDDYNLVIEILYKGQEIGVIKHKKHNLKLLLYPHDENISIPLDWLFALINEINKES